MIPGGRSPAGIAKLTNSRGQLLPHWTGLHLTAGLAAVGNLSVWLSFNPACCITAGFQHCHWSTLHGMSLYAKMPKCWHIQV